MVLKDITMWPEKLKEGLTLGISFYESNQARLPKKFKKIAFVGMGGSGIAGRILKTFFERKDGITVVIIDSPEIPSNIDAETLAIVVTYSGNTWESVDALQILADKFIPTIVLSHGGRASELAEHKNIPLGILPQSATPRSALGNFLGFMCGLFDSMSVLDGCKLVASFCKHADTYIPKFVDPSFFKEFLYAANGTDFFHVWGVSGSSAAFAYRAQTQFNENSKIQAVFSAFPELTHNLVVGFSKCQLKPLVVFFYTDFLPTHMHVAIQSTCEILKEKGVVLYKAPIFGDNLEEQLFNIILWSDFASCYLGKAREVEIDSVKIIEDLKDRYKRNGIK